MGYLPFGDDERRLHQLESRFAPLVRRMIATFHGQRVPLAACQELVARWFGHPNWHAAITRQARARTRDPWPSSSPSFGETPWMQEVPVKLLKSLAEGLQNALNRYKDFNRGPGLEQSDGKSFELMARTMGFGTALEMNRAWAARHDVARTRASWWSRALGTLRPTPPDGPWTWARQEQDLPTSMSRPDAPNAPALMVRALGQDLDSGWWMGMTDDQVRCHTLLVGEAGSGRDTVLAGWVSQAMSQGHGVVWTMGHEPERAQDIEQRFNEQARLCLRGQDRLTLNLSGQPDRPGSRSVRVNLFEGMSAGGLTEALMVLMMRDGRNGMMWMGRSIGLLSAVCMATVWEAGQQNQPLSLARLRAALDLDTLRAMARQEHWPLHVGQALRAYLNALPAFRDPLGDQAAPGHVQEQHGFFQGLITASLDALQPFEERLFSTAPDRWTWTALCQPGHLVLINAGTLLHTVPEIPALLLAMQKSTLAHTLGQSLDKSYAEVVEWKSRQVPCTWVTDNIPSTLVRGMFNTLPSQARGLGIALVSALDNLALAQAFSETPDALEAFLGNVNTRVLMRQADVTALSPCWGAVTMQPVDPTGPAPVDSARPPVPSPEVLRHYAIGEALVAGPGGCWHVGLSHNLRSPT